MLTKQAITRLNKSELEVKLYNGCFNVVTAVANFSKGRKYELSVEVTHKLLEWQCGKRDSVKLVEWQGSSGLHIEIPEELNSLVQSMRDVGQMDDSIAAKISEENKIEFARAMENLCY